MVIQQQIQEKLNLRIDSLRPLTDRLLNYISADNFISIYIRAKDGNFARNINDTIRNVEIRLSDYMTKQKMNNATIYLATDLSDDTIALHLFDPIRNIYGVSRIVTMNDLILAIPSITDSLESLIAV